MTRNDSGGRKPCSRRALLTRAAAAGMLGGVLLTACQDSADEPTVEMNDDMKFEPVNLTVTIGETVIWRNMGAGMVHTATCDATEAADPAHVRLPNGTTPWNSGLIQPGERWEYTFDVPGEYRYFCIPHEVVGMVATITVEP